MNFALRIPDYYKQDIEALKGDISMNQFIVNAIAEKVATLKTLDHLEQRALRGSKAHALNILNNAPDIEPIKKDKL